MTEAVLEGDITVSSSLKHQENEAGSLLTTKTIHFDDILNKLSALDCTVSSETLSELLDSISSLSKEVDVTKLKTLFNPSLAWEELENNKLELITVIMIIKTGAQLKTIAHSTLTAESCKNAQSLMISLMGLFKFHFQLPIDDSNYALKNFGYLLNSPETNVLIPLLDVLAIDQVFEHSRIDKFEKIFTVIVILHSFSKLLFPCCFALLETDGVINKLKRVFNFDLNKPGRNECPTILEVYQRFRFSIQLEETTLINDFKYDNLLNTLFFTSFHKSVMHKLCHSYFSTLKLTFNISDDDIIANALNIMKEKFHSIATVVICYHNTDYLELLKNIASDKSRNQNVRDAAMFSLMSTVKIIYMNSDIFCIDQCFFENYIWSLNPKHFHKIMGVTKYDCSFKTNKTTLLPLFQFRDQNLKLNYLEELPFLESLKMGLLNINSNLCSMDDFVSLNGLLIDCGCSLSIGSLFDITQALLIIIIQKYKFKSDSYIKIPESYIEMLGFHFIPPVHREDFSFTSNCDTQAENFGPVFKLLQEAMDSKINQRMESINLLEQCLLYSVSIKFKIYHYLHALNNETSILRVPNLYSTPSINEEHQLYKFRNAFSKIGMFRSEKALTYKLLSPAVKLTVMSNLSLLILSENYKIMKTYQTMQDASISKILNEYIVSYLTQFVLIYQEFGILTMFKMVRSLNETNLKLIQPTANVISKLFPVKKPEINDTSLAFVVQDSLTTSINEIISQSIISSNLVRQFVELFDDGQSKPFKTLNKFLKNHPSTLKPSKITKGTVMLTIDDYITSF